MGKAVAFGISKFWPKGVKVHGVYLDHRPEGLSYDGLAKAKDDRLKTISAAGLSSLLAIASDLAGRPVEAREILVEGEK